MQKIIVTTLYLLSILVPLIFTPINFELFEFPKFIILLSGTLVITAAWAIHIYQSKDFKIFAHPSIIHYSLFIILLTQSLATLFSINPYTSFWGYYSRFHQGLLTTICYTIIYFAAVKWSDTKSTQKLIKITVYTSYMVSLFAIAQHFGIDKNFWIQDVQNRVFSTLGQPNWLAAYLIPNIFLVLYLAQTKKLSSHLSSLIFFLLFTALLFTKSRSGFLAFGLSYLTYWILLLRQFSFAKIKKSLLLYSGILLLSSLIFRSPISLPAAQKPAGTVLDSGGTESGDIRKIVWAGALNLIKKHPILGTGPETFAYTYYWERPLAHNQTSEWDFLYNKAHNEYLNIAAGAGLIGLAAYLYFHYAVFATSLTLIPQSKKTNQTQDESLRHLYPVLGASIVAFTITNFFGFSVIPVYLMMILIAAIPSSFQNETTKTPIIHYSLFIILIILIYPARLFLADAYYARGKATNSIDLLKKAVAIRPGLDLFHSQLGEAYAAAGATELAIQELNINQKLNPYHLNFFKSRAKIYITLNQYDSAAKELIKSRALAPTDPKLAYNLGLVYTRLNSPALAIAQLQDAISLKPNYGEPYYALTLLYEETKQIDKIVPLLTSAKTNLATYSASLKEKIDKYAPL